MDPEIPTKAFFESDPVAAEIRRLTLDGVAACLHRLSGKDGCDAKIMAAANALQNHGIVAGMHLIETDNPEETAQAQRLLMSSPVRAAEFVGGMFLGYLTEYDGALEIPRPATQEEAETYARLFAQGDAPQEVRLAFIDMGSLSFMEKMLDRQPEEFRPHP